MGGRQPVRPSRAPAEVEVYLVVGAEDELVEHNRQFAATAQHGGHRVSMLVTPAGGNQTILAPRTPEGRAAIREAIRAARGSSG